MTVGELLHLPSLADLGFWWPLERKSA